MRYGTSILGGKLVGADAFCFVEYNKEYGATMKVWTKELLVCFEAVSVFCILMGL